MKTNKQTNKNYTISITNLEITHAKQNIDNYAKSKKA